MKHGIDEANLDKHINPADDFYAYACGGWQKAHPLPKEFARFGMFDLLRENNRKRIKELIINLSATPESKKQGTIAQKVADLYEMGMDAERLNKEGSSPLNNQLGKIENADISTPAGFAKLMAYMHMGITSTFFSSGVGPSPKDSDMNILHVGEGGLGLGDRDYYLEKNENNDKILAAYKVYILRLFELTGYDKEAGERAYENIINIETKLAQEKKTREMRRNPTLSDNPISYCDFKQKYSAIDWHTYFSELDLPTFNSLNISSVHYLEALMEYLPAISARAIKDYLIFQAIDSATGLLSDDFIEASFQMYDVTMSGIVEQQPRWKRAMGIPTSMLGEAVGKLYVEKYFPEENKRHASELVGNLRKALKEHITDLSWMGAQTKAKALEKLEKLTVKIGYPDKWKDYSAIHIDKQLPYLENVYRASVWYCRDNYEKLGKPVDKSEWFMNPQTVNAYYSPMVNEICFPAAILQPPYFDISARDALNYGAIGVVIGHEMTHGFDDQGRRFDSNGNLNEWWTEDDAKRFNTLADKLVAQFDAIEVAPGVHANGRYTLGENIADQGGLRIALTAYQDFTDELPDLKSFYLQYALLWADNIRPEEILVRTKTDPHSLGRWRVNATLRNLQPFYDAFQIKEGDKMFMPDSERVIIW
ncbi:MAG: M13 family metallopeptidase [Prevotella sp.]|nr:M13 family metallopeptidase [Prevotella sp.]MCM1075520.1 M13 family metallopeptidase [Ruminococcus sp.]